MLAIKIDETPDVEYVKERLEMAGYALQWLPVEFPRGHKAAWPDIPRQPLDNWILELLAASGTREGNELKQRLENEASRIRMHATREQMAALDEILPYFYGLKDKAQKQIVGMRMFKHPVSDRYKYSWSLIAKTMGLSRWRVRDLHETALKKISMSLTTTPKAHSNYG